MEFKRTNDFSKVWEAPLQETKLMDETDIL